MSLRLAEAFLRAAAPEGHEPLHSLEDLRGHMYGTHNLDVAYMLPQRTLLHLHEQDHDGAEPEWGGSADSSRAPGFIAVTASAADGPGWWDDLIPGDRITGAEQGARLRAMREHMRGLGFNIIDRDKNGYENLGPNFTLDTGHRVSVGHSRRNEEWHATIHHPGDSSTEKSRIGLNLGVNTGHVVPLLTRELGRQPVIGEMAAQWNRAQRGGGTPIPPRWRFPDGSRWHPQHRSFTARGAQPGDGEP